MSEIKPTPRTVNIECSLCGEPWNSHGDDPTALDCIRLLKARVAKQAPYVWPMSPWQNPVITWGTGTSSPPPEGPQIWCSTGSGE